MECITTTEHKLFATRIADRYHYVNIELSSPTDCAIPYEFVLGQTATGQSLVKEICMKGTSAHYLNMLKTVAALNKDPLC
jgi:hypothetical protein